jgi:2-succinyl-6-hydroxy-2,4-cyclohexadiene-1-carboxylate synthase
MDPETGATAVDRLHAEADGRPDDPRMVLVHGFTQTRECWGPVATDLARDHRVVRVDAPGHGRSGHGEADLTAGAALLGATGGTGTYLGYSMGGRLCWHLALQRPALVGRLVVVGAHPGIEDAVARAARADEDRQRAAHVEAVGVDRFLEEWLALPLFAGLAAEQAELEARRENTAHGLASSLRHAGTGSQEPLWDRLGSLTMPVLLVAGEHDGRYRALSERAAATIGPNATVGLVAGAGHVAHLERPREFLALLRRWLSATAT